MMNREEQARWDETKQLYRKMKRAFTVLIKEYSKRACPCAFPRFRDYIQHGKGMQFVDGECLYSAARETFVPESNEKAYRCKKCGTRYEEKTTVESAYYRFFDIHCIKSASLTDLGPPAHSPIPYCIGFQYLENSSPPKGPYQMAKLNEVVKYLSLKC